jgi:hypothetical protein
MKDDEYRRFASEAEDLADKAKTDNDRAAWLRIAQSWLGLIRGKPPTEEETFEDSASSQGTGQEPSCSSH